MSAKEKPWWEGNGALFGGALQPEMCQAWSQVWANAKGFTNAEMTVAVLALTAVHPAKRPRYPLDIIGWIENTMRANAFQIALAGNMPVDRIAKLLPDWEVDLETARARAAALNSPIETPESNAYRTMRTQIRQLKDRAAAAQIGAKVDARLALPEMRGVGR